MYEGVTTGLRTVVGDIKEFSIIVDLLRLTLSRTCLPCLWMREPTQHNLVLRNVCILMTKAF